MATRRYATFLLTLSALALLGGCDDNGNSSDKTSWIDWIKSKDQPKEQRMALDVLPSDYVRETVSGNFLASQFAQYRQDWGNANKYVDRLIQLDPSNIDLQQRAMILAMQSGDSDRAIMLARKVLGEDSKNLLALLFIGVDQIARQDYDGAIDTLEDMPQNGIADFIRPILIAWSEAPAKKIDLNALIAGGPLHAYHALLIADYMGTVAEPRKYFVNVVTGGGADIHTLEMMADVFARQGQIDLAEKIYDTLIEEYKEGPRGQRLKLLEAKRANPETAGGARLQTPSQGAAEAFYNMARILFQDQSDDSALVFTRIALHLDPDQDEAKLLLARIMIKSERKQDAIEAYKSVGPESPAYLEAQRSAAELLEGLGETDQSIAFLEEIYARDKDANALIQIGDVYRRADRHEEAIKAYNRAIDMLGGKINADHWSVFYARGMSYERTGNLPRAEEDLEAALEFRPNHPYLLNYLGYSWADQGKKLDKALELIAKAAKLKPEDGYIVDSLGWVYYKMGQFEEATVYLEKAVELVPYDPTINDHLGDAYWRVGRRHEARFQWQRALNHTEDEKDKETIGLKIADGLAEEKPSVMEAKHDKPAAAETAADKTGKPAYNN